MTRPVIPCGSWAALLLAAAVCTAAAPEENIDRARIMDLYSEAKALFRRANDLAGASPEAAKELYRRSAMRFERLANEGRLRNGKLDQMTADHTMQSLGMEGPLGAQLSRAVGIWPTVPIDVVMGVPMAGDIYLLCSDGLTKMLKDEAIGAVLRAEREPKAIANGLVAAANARGGKDNITVVIIHVVGPHELRREGGAAHAVSASV